MVYSPVRGGTSDALPERRSLPPGALATVELILTHADCPDGMASAILLRDVYPDVPIYFFYPSSAELRDFPVRPHALFADLSPVPETADAWREAGAIIIDHHASARTLIETFGIRGIFGDEKRDKGACGASLVYDHVWLNHRTSFYREVPLEKRLAGHETVSAFAKLAGIRDTYMRTHPLWINACVQATTLRAYPAEDWLAGPSISDDKWGPLWERRLEAGQVLYRQTIESATRDIRNSYRFRTPKGTSVVVISKAQTTDASEFADADVLIGFSYTCIGGKPQLRLSMRSRSSFDVSVLCESLGGGGHTKAAGVNISCELFKPFSSPYALIESLIEEFEKSFDSTPEDSGIDSGSCPVEP
jgi:hypothetical protein